MARLEPGNAYAALPRHRRLSLTVARWYLRAAVTVIFADLDHDLVIAWRPGDNQWVLTGTVTSRQTGRHELDVACRSARTIVRLLPHLGKFVAGHAIT